MRTIAVANQKGGVAKTNLPGNLAAELSALGHRTVVVDLDPQATLTTCSVPDRLRVAERTLGAQVGSERVLSRALRKLSADVVLIDCPPSMGILTASALVAETAGVIIPLAAAPEALDGYIQVTANLQRLRDALELPIPVVAVVPTRYDHRLRIARDVLDAAKTLCNGTLTSPIRENVALRELFGHRQPARTYRPDSTGTADYAMLATELLARV